MMMMLLNFTHLHIPVQPWKKNFRTSKNLLHFSIAILTFIWILNLLPNVSCFFVDLVLLLSLFDFSLVAAAVFFLFSRFQKIYLQSVWGNRKFLFFNSKLCICIVFANICLCLCFYFHIHYTTIPTGKFENYFHFFLVGFFPRI